MMGDLIVNNIDKRLIELNKTRSRMLMDCGLPEATVRQWKRGSIPLATTLYKIARYLGVTVEFLLTGLESTELNVAEPEKEYEVKEIPEDSKKLLEDFDKLNARDRNLILTMCHSLACSDV